METNSKPWFHNKTVLAIPQDGITFIKSLKILVLTLISIVLKLLKMHLQKMILKKKKSYFEEELAKNRNKPKKSRRLSTHSV